MSDDVLSTLRGLSESVRSRIEATADYKALMVMQRAIGEVESLFAPVAAAAVAAVAVEETTEAPAVEAEAATDEAAVEATVEAPAEEAVAFDGGDRLAALCEERRYGESARTDFEEGVLRLRVDEIHQLVGGTAASHPSQRCTCVEPASVSCSGPLAV